METTPETQTNTHLRAACHRTLRKAEYSKAERLCWELWSKERRASDLANFLLALLMQGKGKRGVAVIQTLEISQISMHAALCLQSANIYRTNKMYTEALKVLNTGIKNHSDDYELKLCRARIFQSMKRFNEAYGDLQRIVSFRKDSFSAWFNLGYTCIHLKKSEESLRAFEKALELEPNNQLTVANIVTILKDEGRLSESRKVLSKLKKQCKEYIPELIGAEAGLLMSEQRYLEGSKLLSELIIRNPSNELNWLNYSACLRGQKLAIQPEQALREALIWHPNCNSLKQAWLQSLCELGLQEQAKRLIKSINLSSITTNNLHLFNLLFLTASNDLITLQKAIDITDKWEKENSSPYLQELWKDHVEDERIENKRKLRIGYLSSDFCNHPVSRFLLPILERHNKYEVEIWGIHAGPNWDKMSQSIKNSCDHWLDIRTANDIQAARLVSDQRLDILVELGGFTGNSRIGICLHKPAKVQMSYLGYPGATYLRAIPWWIGDEQIFKNINKQSKTRHLLGKVKGGYMAFPRPRECTEINTTSRTTINFGSFNHARKITDKTISLWCRVLGANANSCLILKSFSFQNEEEKQLIRRRFINKGLDERRLILLEASKNIEEHLKLYNMIDIALDPIPYGGATTTAEALWMGVPVICQSGYTMAGNLAASVLATANCEQWIYNSEEEYLNGARTIAEDGPRSKDRREELILKIEQSGLNNPHRVSRELERIYKQAIKYKSYDISSQMYSQD